MFRGLLLLLVLPHPFVVWSAALLTSLLFALIHNQFGCFDVFARFVYISSRRWRLRMGVASDRLALGADLFARRKKRAGDLHVVGIVMRRVGIFLSLAADDQEGQVRGGRGQT